jgi:uncharacterized protein (TIGR02266 family)
VSYPDDRRRTPRESLLLKVEYGDAGELVADYTANISAGGTFVLTERPLPVGSEIKLTLSFPGLIRPLPIAATVKWVREGEPGERGVGLAFDLGDAEAQAQLAALIGRIAAGDPALVTRILRVLVVEDNPHVAALIREGLAAGSRRELSGKVSFQFTTVGNGRDALAAVRAARYDVMIVDIYLPVLDGAQVIAAVRADAERRALPIVAVSGGGQPARAAAMAAGADFFLDKPMRLADIVATMRRLLPLD